MNDSTRTFVSGEPAETEHDPDLAQQAVPGHGVPSQDPDVGAQQKLSPQEAEREAKSAYVGGGAMAGMAAGAAAGAVIGGPVGVLVGATAGTIAGALGGEAAGQVTHPRADDSLDRLPVEAEIRSDDDLARDRT